MAYASLLAGTAQAAEFDTGGDVKIRWDNTVKYSAAYRTKDPATETIGARNSNGDDGNLNFRKGLVSNRVDLLSELDVSYKSFGARVSGAAWYDGLYRRENRNDSPATANALPANVFAPGTASLLGRRGEVLDAFVFGQADLGNSKLASFRLGRHALLYGESVYFGSNGIAGTQGPVDVIKALQVPSSQVKEIIRPVNQLSTQVQVRPDLSVGAYYQFEWRKNRLPAAGSFLSVSDFLDDGGARFLRGAPLVPGGGGQVLLRTADVEASNSGQFGAQLRWQPTMLDAEFGLYATRSSAKNPIVHVRPAVLAGIGVVDPSAFNPRTGQVGTYSLVYPEGIKTVGASFSTTTGELNFAGEASLRRDMPLVVAAVPVLPGQVIANHGDTLYPVGNTAHMQVSAIYALSRTAWWQGGSLIAELAWNRRLSVTRQAGLVDPNSTRDASAVRIGFEPVYYQVWSGVDLTIPLNVGYGVSGRSSVIPQFSVEHGGDVTVGISADYQKQWKFGLNYVSFTGGPRPLTMQASSPSGTANTFGQTLADRNFIAFSAQRTF
ncbi:DUF1302 domain-containing protein [Duganella sp. LX47W]|uniref:DUF1302 domain-containing protein n=2 Tax=Rugamonas apoptosis TaxID=2758570 RepID=A0A7W2IIX5_9BURK|nr:DUF1302 domain-containing protein [Rugamonas apoptosis]